MTGADHLVVEFLHPDDKPVLLLELGFEFLEARTIPAAKWERPFRLELDPRTSKKGNTYFDYTVTGVPLPDGLATRVRLGGVDVSFGDERLSSNGNPTVEGRATLRHADVPYDGAVYITEGRRPFYVKVHAHRAAATKRMSSGGRIL